jgi:hypothetical protein
VITWTPTTQGVVSLGLGTGPSGDVQIISQIASGIPNSGVCIIGKWLLTSIRVSVGQFQLQFLKERTTPSRLLLGKFFAGHGRISYFQELDGFQFLGSRKDLQSR